MDSGKLVAFTGIKLESSDDFDIAQVLEGHADDEIVYATMYSMEQIADRILELSAIVQQNALVGMPAAQAEHESVTVDVPVTRNELSAEREAQMKDARARATKREGSIL